MRTVGWNVVIVSFAYLASAAELPKKCSAPPEYPHTTLVKKYSSRKIFNAGEKIYYDCAEDFTPSKGFRAVQCSRGKWTKLTLKCEKKSCGNAGDLPNGQFEYEGNSYLGEKVFAVCNQGYTLKGPNYMICKKSGWTGEIPTCEEGEATCSTPAVANSLSPSGEVVRAGDSVNITCREGFQLDGAQQITCGPDGRWGPLPPQCLRTYVPTQLPDKDLRCGVPEAVRNADLADRFTTMKSFASGDRVHYVCEVGHVQAGGSRYRKCVAGKWTPLHLRCERKLCGSAGEITNGEFVYTGVQFGDTATAVCDEGHLLVGQATRNCMAQGWDGRVPICEAIDCGEPPKVANAELQGSQEPPFTYRSTVHYRCLTGTLIGSREVWCTQDGTWSTPPTCNDVTCPPPRVPGGFWSGASRASYEHRDSITIECKPGYASTGPRVVTCGSDGRWSPGLPRCAPRARPVRRRN
ncbi:complement receptor type 1-like isoform X1 [Takifugu flavidus]|uniref:C4b-binding protein alpha chain n=1 Tax=Takifugu flavidus TaxID=433684 RepID=A0A5C6MUC5_9TELE|nr:complement receptor type 1-like isoform X1 [Takifugu flavidus]TWW56937.1 C4b-binding protein alpha chain [Takifugu flavidus]